MTIGVQFKTRPDHQELSDTVRAALADNTRTKVTLRASRVVVNIADENESGEVDKYISLGTITLNEEGRKGNSYEILISDEAFVDGREYNVFGKGVMVTFGLSAPRIIRILNQEDVLDHVASKDPQAPYSTHPRELGNIDHQIVRDVITTIGGAIAKYYGAEVGMMYTMDGVIKLDSRHLDKG